MDRIIFHCDLNSFFASVELLERPDLRHLPVAVGGDEESRHGIVLAKNDRAKAFGVQTAQTLWQAKQCCPDLVVLPGHYQKYIHYSRVVNQIYQSYTDLVEPYGIDESWLDVTGSLHLFGGDPVALADALRQRVRVETGLTVSVGVSFNKVFAKLGSDYKKPDATTYFPREAISQMVYPLPVKDLLYVGRASETVLKKFGITTIGQLAAFDRAALVTLMGKQGGMLWDFANGLDTAPVAAAGQYTPPKSVGNGVTFPRNLEGADQIRGGILMLADQVAGRLRKHGMKCLGVSVSLRDSTLHSKSHQRRLDTPSWLGREIGASCMSLAEEFWNMSTPVRAITVTALSLLPAQEAGEQLNLLSQQNTAQRDKQERLEQTLDKIRDRYGKSAIQSASRPRGVSQSREDT